MSALQLFAILISVAVVSALIPHSALAEDIARMGLVLPLTGPRASLGRDALDAAGLAVEVLRADGRTPPQLVFEDSEGLPSRGVTAFQKLVQAGIKVIVTQHSNVSLPVLPLANRDRIVLIGSMTTSDAYSTPDDYGFRVNGTVYGEAVAMAEHLTKSGTTYKSAVIAAEDEYPEALKRNLLVELARLSAEAVFVQTVLPKDQDLRTTLAQARSRGAEQLVFLGYPDQAGVLAKQVKQLGFRARVILLSTPCNIDQFFASAGDAAEGVRVTTLKIKSASEEAKLYETRFQRSLSVPAANAYDAVVLGHLAFERCRFKADSECLRQALRSIRDFKGISGQHGFDERNGDMFDTYQILEARDGRFVPLAE